MTALPINYLAVLVSIVAVIIVSFVWYGPLFGKFWMNITGIDKLPPEQLEAGRRAMPKNMLIQIVATFFMVWVLAHSIIFGNAFMGTSGITGGLMAGFMSWLGFVMPVTIGMVLWEGKPWKYWFLVAGNWLINLLLIGVILGAWR